MFAIGESRFIGRNMERKSNFVDMVVQGQIQHCVC